MSETADSSFNALESSSSVTFMEEHTPTADGDVVVHPDGHRVHWWRYGSGSQTLVVLHGGPGYDHRHQLNFARLAEGDVQVVFYDQLGSGRSDRPEDDPSLWRIDRFVEELDTVRTALGLGRVHLAGHSWGGFLAQQYALDRPDGVASLVLANTAASCPDLASAFAAVRAAVPEPANGEMTRLEAAGRWDAPEYQELVLREIMAERFRRSTPFDRERSLQELAEVLPLFEDAGPSRVPMFGDRPFEMTGSLSDWDVKDRLHELDVPTLVLSSAHDAVSPDCGRAIAERVAGSEFVIFGQSSHMVMLEHEAPAFFGVVADFVRRHPAL